MSSPPLIPTADRISALPDSLICHMLSFLPTKPVVATSILSKRWTHLWRSVPTLDFDDESFTDFAIFRHFVYSVIVSREITPPLRSFRIKCGSSKNFDPFDVNRFVHAAGQRQIENFDLHLFSDVYGDLKELTTGVFRLLSCRTLVVLKLKNLTVHDVPQLVDLPLLKTLNLDCVHFEGGFAHFSNLLRGCPILEDFHTQDVKTYKTYLNDEMDGDFEGFPYLLRANLSVYPNLPLL